MNSALPYLQCTRSSEQQTRQFHVQGFLPKLKTLHITTIGSMATSCTWNPKQTTDDLAKERTLKPVFAWNGEGTEPEHSSMIKQLLWNYVQEQLQDTRNRFDPRLRDIAQQWDYTTEGIAGNPPGPECDHPSRKSTTRCGTQATRSKILFCNA